MKCQKCRTENDKGSLICFKCQTRLIPDTGKKNKKVNIKAGKKNVKTEDVKTEEDIKTEDVKAGKKNALDKMKEEKRLAQEKAEVEKAEKKEKSKGVYNRSTAIAEMISSFDGSFTINEAGDKATEFLKKTENPPLDSKRHDRYFAGIVLPALVYFGVVTKVGSKYTVVKK